MRWLDVYTVTGGTLGILAFAKALFSSIAAANKDKWAKLAPTIITEQELFRLSQPSTSFCTISAEVQRALLSLNNKLTEKGDAFRFRSLFSDPFAKHLQTLEEVSGSMRTRFSGGEWTEMKKGEVLNFVHLNHEHFERLHGSSRAAQEMQKVCEQLRLDLNRALHALTAIRELATREDVDYLFFWRFSKYR